MNAESEAKMRYNSKTYDRYTFDLKKADKIADVMIEERKSKSVAAVVRPALEHYYAGGRQDQESLTARMDEQEAQIAQMIERLDRHEASSKEQTTATEKKITAIINRINEICTWINGTVRNKTKNQDSQPQPRQKMDSFGGAKNSP